MALTVDTTNTRGVYQTDSRGNDLSPTTYALVAGASLAAGASSASVTVRASGTYALNVVMSGTGPIKLQSLGPDTTTWLDVVSVSATGSTEVNIYAGSGGATLRVTNGGSSAVTNLFVSVVS